MIDTITTYFADMPTSHRTIQLVGGLSLFFLVENLFPFFTTKYNKWKHTGINLFFTLTTVLVNFLLAFIFIKASDWTSANSFGIVHWLSFSTLATVIIGILLMDFIGAYLIHYIEHKVKFLWRFHIVHHTDQHVNTTTANRHHPGESVLRFIFTLGAILIIGAPIWLIFLYQSMSLMATQFTHSNINMPKWLDDTLMLLFVTPNMHRVHHHYRQPYTDTNFGNIFSIWDRLLGTFTKVDNRHLIYGLDTHMDEQDANSIKELLVIPLKEYREEIAYDDQDKLS